jgi:hypothetical protein
MRSPRHHLSNQTTSRLAGRAARRSFPSSHFDQLEPRTLFYSWTAQEVYFAELVNRARANPAAEATRLGIDLSAGLTSAEQALLVSKFPLTLNAALTTSTRMHSADMAAHNFFDHINLGGGDATLRAHFQNYQGTAGENIGGGYDTIDALYRSWMGTPDERRNILSLYTTFDSTYRYDDLGFGVAANVPGAAFTSYYTADFGNPTPATRRSNLTGVVFTDTSGDNFYTIGEGLANIRIDAYTGSNTSVAPVATYTTDAAGNYQFPLTNGSYTVVFTRTSDNFRVAKTVTVSGVNVKLDAKASELAPLPDDYPNAGQWSQAAAVTVDPATGNGALTGAIIVSGDSDLFTFTAPRSGAATISLAPVGGAFTGRIRIYNSSQTLLATGTPGTPSTTSTASITLTAGQTYFVLADAGVTAGTGSYVLLVQGPPPPPDDFADSGQWSQAAVIPVDSGTGSGTRSGQIALSSDSDLFTFTTRPALDPHATTLFAHVTGGDLVARVRIYNAAHALIGTGTASGADSTIQLSLAGSTTYFMLVDALSGTGSYTVGEVPLASPPVDDYANAGEWDLAAALAVDSSTGNATITGRIENPGDADLFTFLAGKAGVTTIASIVTGGAVPSRIRIYDNAHTLIATGVIAGNGLDSTASATLTQGQRYFALVDSTDASAVGLYSVQLTAPADPPIPPQYLDAGGQPINPVYLGTKPTLAFINQLGHASIAVRSATGAWSLTDLQTSTSSPGGATSLISWVEPRDGLLYAAAATPSGLILYKLGTNNTWSFRNITFEVKISRAIVSNLATFVDNAGLRQIGGLTAEGHLVTYWMTGLLWPQGWRYYYTDLSSRDLTLRNHAQPTMAGNFVTYVTQKNSLNYVGTDPNGNVILFFRPSGGLATQLWNWTNLTQLTQAAKFVGNITATETSNRIVNISGTDASGNLWMITWRSGEGWKSRNITGATTSGGSVPLATGTVASWINSAGSGFVAGVTGNGALVLYRYTFTGGQNTWTFATLSASIPGAPQASGKIRATALSNGTILISAATDAGELLRYTFTPGTGGWTAENVTDLLA